METLQYHVMSQETIPYHITLMETIQYHIVPLETTQWKQYNITLCHWDQYSITLCQWKQHSITLCHWNQHSITLCQWKQYNITSCQCWASPGQRTTGNYSITSSQWEQYSITLCQWEQYRITSCQWEQYCITSCQWEQYSITSCQWKQYSITIRQWKQYSTTLTPISHTYPTSITQSQCVKGANSKEFPIGCPGNSSDGVLMGRTAVHQASKCVPHLQKNTYTSDSQSDHSPHPQYFDPLKWSLLPQSDTADKVITSIWCFQPDHLSYRAKPIHLIPKYQLWM